MIFSMLKRGKIIIDERFFKHWQNGMLLAIFHMKQSDTARQNPAKRRIFFKKYRLLSSICAQNHRRGEHCSPAPNTMSQFLSPAFSGNHKSRHNNHYDDAADHTKLPDRLRQIGIDIVVVKLC